MQISEHLETSDSFLDLLEQNSFDASLQKAIMKHKIQYPTAVQSKIIQLYTKRSHFLLSSSGHSGKSLGIALIMLNKLIQKGVPEENKAFFGVFLCPSKEICLKNTILLEKLLVFSGKQHNIRVKNLMENIDDLHISLEPNCNYILIGTPTRFLSFYRSLKLEKTLYISIAFDDCDYLISFGYKNEVLEIKESLNNNEDWCEKQVIISVSSEINEEMSQLKKILLSKSVTIKVEDNEEPEEQEISEEILSNCVNQIYHIGPNIHKFILTYLCFKLKLISGKTLILCHDDFSMYKVELFLKRTGIPHSHIYNEKDPKSLKSYIISIFNSGLIQIIIAKNGFFEDVKKLKCLQRTKGDENIKKVRKLVLKPIDNIILFDLKGLNDDLETYFTTLKKIFHPKMARNTNFITFIENNEIERNFFSKIIENLKENYRKLNLNKFPLKDSEIEAFKYRLSDVVTAISLKQIKSAQMLDFKRQLLKSQKMQKYFEKNIAEKEALKENVSKLSADLNKYAIRLYDDIPEYLMPEIAKQENKLFENIYNPRKKISFRKYNEDFEKSLKRRVENNNLTMDDVKKKINIDGERTVFIDEDKENPNEMDPDRLKPLSNRKQWKIKHKFSLKKKNKRLEKKGVFQ